MGIREMASSIHHRGPDGRGAIVEEVTPAVTLGLGHTRLAIVDLSDNAAQPMASSDGRFVLVYNGEVYNYRELAAELDCSRALGDTAVVLAALSRWGPAALARFNGMWSLLLFDRREQKLLISRDRFGIKPLYYCEHAGATYFSSEIKAILCASGAALPLNARAAVPYLSRGLLNCTDETFFTGIKQFPPASYQEVDLGEFRGFSLSPSRYWEHPIELGREPKASQAGSAEVRELFIDAVQLRLRSDVPVGVLLSGGVDSSAILGAIAAERSSDVTVLSVVSDDARSTEEPFIDLMSRSVGLQPEKTNVSRSPLGLLSRLDDAIWYNDEPVCGIADIAYLMLMEEAQARGLKVLLSGQGADEQLGGYNKFVFFWLMTLLREAHPLRAVSTVARFWKNSDLFRDFRLSEAIRYIGKRGAGTGSFLTDAARQLDTVDVGLRGTYSQREWVDVAKTSVPQLLHYEDRMSMSRSIEVRVPFLDYRLVELLASVHPSEKFRDGRTKAIFRDAIHGLVPDEIRYRRDKRGFNVPEDIWMKSDFREPALEMFSGNMRSASLGIVDQQRLLKLYRRFLAGSGLLNGRHFLRLFIFERFLHRFQSHLTDSPPGTLTARGPR